MPFFGRRIRRNAALALLEDATVPAIEALLNALPEMETELRKRALGRLKSFTNPPARRFIQQSWTQNREHLTPVLRAWNTVDPEHPERRVFVLTSLLLNQLDQNWQVQDIEHLIDALDDEEQLAQRASQILIGIYDPDLKEEVCCQWIESRDGQILDIIRQWNAFPEAIYRGIIFVSLKLNRSLNASEEKAMPHLVDAFKDKELRSLAEQRLRDLRTNKGKDACCAAAIENESLRSLAVESDYRPTNPHQRALFLFLASQWEEYEAHDFDQSLLRMVFQTAKPELRQRIVTHLRESAKPEILRVLTDTTTRLTRDEWTTTFDLLIQSRQPGQIWNLIQRAPIDVSLPSLQRLMQWNWQPNEADRDCFDSLVEALPDYPDEIPKRLRFDSQRPTEPLKLSLGLQRNITQIIVSRDGRYLASLDEHSIVCLWSLEKQEAVRARGLSKCTNLLFTPDSTRLITLDAENLCVWNLKRPDQDRVYPIPKNERQRRGVCLATDEQGQRVFLVFTWGVAICDLNAPPESAFHWQSEDHQPPLCVAVSADGSRATSGSLYQFHHSVWEISESDPNLVHKIRRDPASPSIVKIAFSEDNDTVFCVDQKATLSCWSTETGERRTDLNWSDWPLSPDTAFTPLITDGEHLSPFLIMGGLPGDSPSLARAEGKRIRLWESESKSHIKTIQGLTSEVRCLASNPQHQILAAALQDNSIWVWTFRDYLHTLTETPIEELTREDWHWVRHRLQLADLPASERNVLRVVDLLLGRRLRHDIEIISTTFQPDPTDILLD